MKKITKLEVNKVIDWSVSVMGQVKVISDHSKVHGGHESSTCRLQTPSGFSYLKVHESPSYWNNEVHAYERWASSFGEFAPKLLAVRDEEPLALIVSELPGEIVENKELPAIKEQALWRTAGKALALLHSLGRGEFFGPSLRDGTCSGEFIRNAEEYISRKFKNQMEEAISGRYINDEELGVIRTAYELIPAFKGESPVPCHRDYCMANWLINDRGDWTGVIDFEFAHWDVCVSDFARYPDWSWMDRPDLIDAFFEGYGRSLSHREEEQLLVAHAEYALSAIIWGHDNSFYGFEREGREALLYLASRVGR